MPKIDYTEDPVAPEVSTKFDSKATSKFFDPCQEAANRSLKCLRRNMGDRELCMDFFQAYRDCKAEWINKRKEERWKNAWWGVGNKSEDTTGSPPLQSVDVKSVDGEESNSLGKKKN